MKKREFPLFGDDCKSLLCRYLSPELYETLSGRETRYGFTIDDAIASGVLNPDSSIGVYAGDEESYSLFGELFDPIIRDYHGFTEEMRHTSDLDPSHLKAPNPDPEGRYILSTRIRVGRNLHCFPLAPSISSRERLICECMISDALKRLEGDLKGSYHPLENMDDSVKREMIENHFLFKEGDRFLEAAGANRDWPRGRGIYHNEEKSFLVWVNEEDQMRIISMQRGADIEAVFSRLSRALKALERELFFAFDERLGYIGSCPTNLGTAMRASVHIRIPKLAEDMQLLQSITDKHHLQIRGTDGEHSLSREGIFDISNRRRLGISEVEAVQGMYDGIVELIETEKRI